MALPLAACKDGPAGPGSQASLDAALTDDPATPSGAVAPGPSFSQSSTDGSLQGSFQAEVKVQVSVDGETWVELGPLQQVSLELRSGERATVHASASVPASSFTRARLVVQSARATVLAGSTVGTGIIDVNAEISIAGGAEVVVEKSVNLDLTTRSRASLTFDLNSDQWIDETAVQAQSVSAAQVQNAVTVQVN